MLTNEDIDYIRKSREEIRTNRTDEVIVYGTNIIDRHPVTGEAVRDPYRLVVDAILTEVSVRTAVDRYRDNGIEIRTGDIIVDLSIKDLPTEFDQESIESVTCKGLNYTVVASDSLGLGEYNRVEVVGRRTK